MTQLFTPGATASISATSTSGSASVTAANNSVRVVNLGPNKAFIRWGVGAQTAVASTDMPVHNGATEIFDKGRADTLAAICASGETATLYLTSGEGE